MHVKLFEIPFQKVYYHLSKMWLFQKEHTHDTYRLVHSRTTDYPMNLECIQHCHFQASSIPRRT